MNWNQLPLRVRIARVTFTLGGAAIIIGLWLPTPWLFILGLADVILALMLDPRG